MLTEEAIVEQIQADPEMMKVLAIIRDLNLTDAWLAAGAVRNFIWNQLSGKPGFDATFDDVISGCRGLLEYIKEVYNL